jgi:hypothetical protein
MTTSTTIWKMNGRKRIDQLTRMPFPAVKSTLAYGNTRGVTAIGCFHFKGRATMKFKNRYCQLNCVNFL